ncbi:MAG: hypothetical protein JGK17_14755 [Microcoleus sp. PH2017_10_PVI_O_A]|uniref:hypothetical protein n=1 Tax=unclassified Microcoleus TaxID=2642155 RepID=UPI001D1AD184|nr:MULTISPECIES: hypothetical protein [unclassified Microcoleus]TAE82296.1 MAG: hypothetical protein EAZ83_12695 [Oscillatoriales cyanobacterium]MCC3406820.1 hypothetical protein [Microcoleus sp. PH2017_10_PVI_O_A]MCC3460955.1 hypothetical protein [Microcoleus sp. PH2017_11_PCY_U_A]MCC3479477.1 hypothetical protein [Microcoleus sp. PH2017_12_PCY_D_A]MCC3526809.1 hypothetical protein [Microcoleus sp. PH2017_21_RUC_O_A]
MRGRGLFWAIFAGVVTAFTIALLTPNSALARPEVSVTEIRWFNYTSKDGWQSIQFIVPDRHTAQSTNSRKLRLYDVHIAKMFEISRFLCDRDRTSEGYNWSYQADNGNIDMGSFKISCESARFTATTYGLGKPENTVIRRNFNQKDGRPSLAVAKYSIPTLNVAKNRVLQWRDFVQKIPTIPNKSGANQAKSRFPVSNIFAQIKGKTRVPVFLPNILPFSDTQQLDFDVQAGSHGYIVGMYLGKGCRGGACTFGTIEAKRDEPISPPSQLPRDTYRSIELAGGMKGTYFQTCGNYCIASVEWQRQGVLYRVSLKNGRQSDVVQIVNSALQAGQR